MKVSTKAIQTEFVPYTITIDIESKKEYEILFRILNKDTLKAAAYVNESYTHNPIDADEIKIVTDKIYYANQNANCQLYENDVVPMRCGVKHELDEQIHNDSCRKKL